jgi:hypothetical protein
MQPLNAGILIHTLGGVPPKPCYFQGGLGRSQKHRIGGIPPA